MDRRTVVLLIVVGFGLSCGTEVAPPVAGVNTVTAQYRISDEVKPSQETVPGLNGGPGRTVGAAIGPDGKTEEYIQDEVVVQAQNATELDEIVTKYGGEVLDDGSPTKIPESARALEQSSGYVLVKVDLSRSTLDDLNANLTAAGVVGQFTFSSESAARLAALILREQPTKITPNLLVAETAVLEHPDGMGGNIDWALWPWMTEDDDPNLAGDQGLSVGVVHAWDYLRGNDVPPPVWSPPHIAVIDRGFALDETTGLPLNGNLDYFAFTDGVPWQWDIVDNDNRAGGESSSGGWHGTEAFGVCCALPRNFYGSAGTGGEFVRPMLIKTGATLFSLADGIRYAAIWGADVLSVSLGVESGTLSKISGADENIQNAVYTAVALGATIVAAAGNGNNSDDLSDDISNENFLPCTLDGVICVGSVDRDGNNLHNYGNGVDIWAPTNLYTTVTPETAGNVGLDELAVLNGTSASAPFLAGIVGLMKAIRPDLYWDEVQAILQNTANPSGDPKVAHGYVDAFRAVQALLPPNQLPRVSVVNNPPSVQLISPSAGKTFFVHQPINFGAYVSDAEQSPFPQGNVTWNSDLDGNLGTGWAISKTLSKGIHTVTVTAVDDRGVVGEDSIFLSISSGPGIPSATITSPADGTRFFPGTVVPFEATGTDPEDGALPADSFVWSSSVDGFLGIGGSLHAVLSGPATPCSPEFVVHTITLYVTDSDGNVITYEFQVSVGSAC